MRITIHARGGFSVYGGSRDPRTNEALVYARDGETVALTIDYPSAPSSLTKSEDGISATTPTITGDTASTTLSSIQDGGTIDITATVAGEVRIVRVRGVAQSEADLYPC
jgi:hypothetical protein